MGKNNSKAIASILLLIILTGVILLPGCWDSRNIEKLAMVVAIGVDQGDVGGSQYRVTFQVIRPDLIGTGDKGGGGGSLAQAVWNTTVEGKSIFDAIRKAQAHTPRILFFGHTQVVIFGEDMAKNGVGPAMDFIQRETELRRTVRIVVAKGEAKTLLDANPGSTEVPALSLLDTLNLQERFSLNFSQIMGNFAAGIDKPARVALAPGVARIKNSPVDENVSEKRVEQTAVFRDDKLAAWLTEVETGGLLWARGLIQESALIFTDPVDDLNSVNVRVTRARTDIDVRLEQDIPVFTIKIIGEGRLASQTSSHDLFSKENTATLNKRAANTIRDKIENTVKRSKELQLDLIGLGDKLAQRYPVYWKEAEGNWENILPRVKVEIDSQFKIRKSGLIEKPIRFKD